MRLQKWFGTETWMEADKLARRCATDCTGPVHSDFNMAAEIHGLSLCNEFMSQQMDGLWDKCIHIPAEKQRVLITKFHWLYDGSDMSVSVSIPPKAACWLPSKRAPGSYKCIQFDTDHAHVATMIVESVEILIYCQFLLYKSRIYISCNFDQTPDSHWTQFPSSHHYFHAWVWVHMWQNRVSFSFSLPTIMSKELGAFCQLILWKKGLISTWHKPEHPLLTGGKHTRCLPVTPDMVS